VNARWSEMAGRPAAEALGGGWLKALHPDDRDRVVEELYRATREDRCFESKFRFQRPDGAVSWALGQALPERDIHGSITGFTGAVTDLTQYIHTENELRASKTKLGLRNEQLRRLALRLGLTQERERRRIAAGLHDEVGQLLAVARVKLEKLVGKLMPTGAHGEVAADAREIGALVDRAIRETRSLTFDLSSPVLHELGLGPAVESLCEQLDKESGVRFSVKVNTESGSISEELRVLLFQAVRELCANVVKHARAPHAEVRVHADRDRIRIVVADEGKGFDSSKHAHNFDQQGGFGLFAIREMSSQMGGSFEIESTPGEGTSAALSVPLS
jgi:PAS domain S-box-containing protein